MGNSRTMAKIKEVADNYGPDYNKDGSVKYPYTELSEHLDKNSLVYTSIWIALGF